jgi:flagellar biosynthesis/type III secretory pathway protein FliH
MEKGLRKGIREGRRKGLEEGIQQGAEKEQERVQKTIKTMYENGLTKDFLLNSFDTSYHEFIHSL